MRDYMIVVYEGARAIMQRGSGGPWHAMPWKKKSSALTRAEQSVWRWDRPIRVKHIYIGHEIIEQTANQVFEKDIDRVRIDDRVRAEDPIIPVYAKMLESELHGGGSAKDCM